MISVKRFLNLSIASVMGLLTLFNPQTGSALVLQQGTVETVDGKLVSGVVQSIDRQGTVRGPGLPDALDLKSVLKIETGYKQKAVPYPISIMVARKQNAQAKYVATSLFGVDSAELKNEKVSLRSQTGSFELPMQAVRAIVWSSSRVVENAIATPSRDEDRVVVQIGDRQQTVAGIVESIDQESVAINYKNKLRNIGLEKVKAVILADVGFKAPQGVLASIQLTDGAVWQGAINSMLPAENKPQSVLLSLQVSQSTEVKIAREKISSIAIASDRLALLSNLEPIDVRESTDFVVARTFQKDRSVVGGPLWVLGTDGKPIGYKKGLGTQATSRLDFRNDNAFTRFAAVVGIDLATEGRGDCRVIVRVDGVEKWNQRVAAGQPAKSIDVDISGSDRISLIVLPGREFDLADHVNWCNARFIKTD